MLQINSFKISSLRNDECFDFVSRAYTIGEGLLTQEVDKAILAQFKPAIDAYDKALKQTIKNSHTEALAEADSIVDNLYIGLTYYVRGMARHPIAELAEKAKQVVGIIDKYGSVVKLSYSQQYGALTGSMQELAALPDETTTALQLADWLASLSSGIAKVQFLRDQQTAEQSHYLVGLTKDTRKAAEEAYRQFTESINAFARAFGEAGYADYINQLNTIIANHEANIKSRQTHAAKNDKEGDTDAETPVTPEA